MAREGHVRTRPTQTRYNRIARTYDLMESCLERTSFGKLLRA